MSQQLRSYDVIPPQAQSALVILRSENYCLFTQKSGGGGISWLVDHEVCRTTTEQRPHQWLHRIAGQLVLDYVELIG